MFKIILKISLSALIYTNFLPLEAESNEMYCKKAINNSLFKLKLEIPKLREPQIKGIEVVDINNDNRSEILITRHGGGNCCPPKIEIIYFNLKCNPKRDTLNKFDGVWNGWEDVKFKKINDGVFLEAITNGEGNGFRKLDVEIVKYLFDGENITLYSNREKKELKAIAEIRTLDLDIEHPYGKQVELIYDLNHDNINETISCNYWDRWGRFTNCSIKFDEPHLVIKMNINPKRLGILKEKKNGWNLLVSDYDEKYFFNPITRNYEN